MPKTRYTSSLTTPPPRLRTLRSMILMAMLAMRSVSRFQYHIVMSLTDHLSAAPRTSPAHRGILAPSARKSAQACSSKPPPVPRRTGTVVLPSRDRQPHLPYSHAASHPACDISPSIRIRLHTGLVPRDSPRGGAHRDRRSCCQPAGGVQGAGRPHVAVGGNHARTERSTTHAVCPVKIVVAHCADRDFGVIRIGSTTECRSVVR